jgi:cold-inducible RNA-binding protein
LAKFNADSATLISDTPACDASRPFGFDCDPILLRGHRVEITPSERQYVNIYVGNLPFTFNSDDLQRLFEAHGSVDSAQVLTDRDTGRSRGFGFVEMGDDDDARKAMQDLDGKDVDGRNLKVNEANPRTERSSRSRF